MKRLFEPLTGFILSFISWAAISDFLISILVAFIGGAAAYAGKWLCQKCITGLHRRNVFVSKTRQRINERATRNP